MRAHQQYIREVVWFPDPSCMVGARKAMEGRPIEEGSGNQTIREVVWFPDRMGGTRKVMEGRVW